jgi:hypothetical protein
MTSADILRWLERTAIRITFQSVPPSRAAEKPLHSGIPDRGRGSASLRRRRFVPSRLEGDDALR